MVSNQAKADAIEEMLYAVRGHRLPEICDPITQKRYAFMLVQDMAKYVQKLREEE